MSADAMIGVIVIGVMAVTIVIPIILHLNKRATVRTGRWTIDWPRVVHYSSTLRYALASRRWLPSFNPIRKPLEPGEELEADRLDLSQERWRVSKFVAVPAMFDLVNTVASGSTLLDYVSSV
jgi:hypothetical protein